MSLPWRLPLMQAPIGPAATPDLVAAVSRLGALGTLAASWTPVDVLEQQVSELRAVVGEPFCVNLVLAFEQRARLEAALSAGAPAISFSWGVDPELIAFAHAQAAFVLVQVGDADEASAAEEAGADAVIVQGVEAGGHVQARRPLLELLDELRKRLRVPLVAAGGIADARSAAAARDAGADAVACGTAFLAASEADVHPVYGELLFRAGARETLLTEAFDGGWPDAPHRVLRNSTVSAWEDAGRPRNDRPGEGEIVARRGATPIRRYDDAMPTEGTSGEIEAMALYAGTSVEAVVRREPAAAIVARIQGDAAA